MSCLLRLPESLRTHCTLHHVSSRNNSSSDCGCERDLTCTAQLRAFSLTSGNGRFDEHAQNHAIDSGNHSLRFKRKILDSLMHMLTVIGSIRLEADLASS